LVFEAHCFKHIHRERPQPECHEVRQNFGLLITLALSLLVAPPASDAQPPGQVAQIGILANAPWPPLETFRHALCALGHAEGQNLTMVYRWAQGRAERFPALAAELVQLPVDVILMWGTPAALAAKQALAAIPIVMGSIGDPVEAGLVGSLAHPGGNITGMTSISVELEEKRLELLKAAVPTVSRVAVLANPANPFAVLSLKRTHAAAQALAVQPSPVEVQGANDVDRAFAAIIPSAPRRSACIRTPLRATRTTDRGVRDQEPHAVQDIDSHEAPRPVGRIRRVPCPLLSSAQPPAHPMMSNDGRWKELRIADGHSCGGYPRILVYFASQTRMIERVFTKGDSYGHSFP
jgi:ABC-type uncharacterized transport system substrate-binding protein